MEPYRRAIALMLLASVVLAAEAADLTSAPVRVLSAVVSNSTSRLSWLPSPSVEDYEVLSSANVSGPYTNELSGEVAGFDWTGTIMGPARFFKLRITPLEDEGLFAATLLNRIAYGPTPDELKRILRGPSPMGPEAFLEEQLAPETIEETLDEVTVVNANGRDWVYVTTTGTSVDSHSQIWVYFSGAGDTFIDDIVLVEGTMPEAGPNLVVNGGFEASLGGTWQLSSNYVTSVISTSSRRSGMGSLHINGTGSGSGLGNSIWQRLASPLPAGESYTLSFWYLPSDNPLTVRVPNANIQSVPGATTAGLGLALDQKRATVADLRTWYGQHAVLAKRQLLEVLTQFCDNHFVTRSFKSFEYHDFWLEDNDYSWRLATDWEWRELKSWREILMTPEGTFHDLLVASSESPAMIIYLDTARSLGNPPNIPNENYARELLELFTCGLDNGYDQGDIVEMSKVWSGWTVRVVDSTNFANPLAPPSTTVKPGATNSTLGDLEGVWAFNFNPDVHYPDPVTLFLGKTVPARFGSPWTGRPYELRLPGRTGTNGIMDGYEVLRHLANLPFTQEFISVKLCRWFVHDDFEHGYDFTDPNLSAEGRLVRDCMLAWENAEPQGQLRPVLRTIFDSELFRKGGASQKIKTPLEFVVSTVRSLRSRNADGSYSAVADAYSFAGILKRMGGMELFNRLAPDGYPESGQEWLSAGTLAERLRFVQSFCIPINQPGHLGEVNDARGSYCDPVGLLRRELTPERWSEAGAVADYFLSILFPGEGKANLDLLRRAAISYLNRADDGVSASLFESVSTAGYPSAYEQRVRGMVALLLSSPRFQEQ